MHEFFFLLGSACSIFLLLHVMYINNWFDCRDGFCRDRIDIETVIVKSIITFVIMIILAMVGYFGFIIFLAGLLFAKYLLLYNQKLIEYEREKEDDQNP